MSSATSDAASTAATQDSGLRGNSIGVVSLTAQVVAQLGPVASVALLVGFVAVSSGNGAWLTWVLATATILVAAFCFSRLTHRTASSGGLASLLAREAGPFPGVVAALGIAGFGLGLSPFLGQVFGIYLRDYLAIIGLTDAGDPNTWIVLVGGLVMFLVGGFLCARDVRLSTAVMLVVELASLAVLVALLLLALVRTDGARIDRAQLTLDGVSAHGVVLGIVLAVFMFLTFEAAITFSQETTAAKRTIATSMYAAVAITGLLMIVATYVLMLALRNAGLDVAASPNPLADLADVAGVHWMSYVLQLGIIVGMFAGTIALTNWLSRLIYTLGRERILPSALGVAHPRHRTPARATAVCVVVQVAVLTVVALLGKVDDLTFYSYIGSYFSLLYCFVYVVALLTIAVVSWRRWEQPLVTVLSLVASAVLGYVIWNSVVPAPAPPLDTYTYASLATMGVVLAVGWIGSRRRGSRLARLGSSSVDLL